MIEDYELCFMIEKVKNKVPWTYLLVTLTEK